MCLERRRLPQTKKILKALLAIDKRITDENLPLRFAIHSGETTHTEYPFDTNIATLLSLKNCKRIGHCVSLWKYPALIDKIKQQHINIELCPISNRLMGYVNTIENHPGISYISQGISCSISSDNQSATGYDYVTFDWFECILRWKLSLQEIRSLCVNSIDASFVSKEVKAKMINDFDRDWSSWLSQLMRSGSDGGSNLMCISCNVKVCSKAALLKHLDTKSHAKKSAKSRYAPKKMALP